MPTFKDTFPEQDRWALAYYVLSLSAYKDPLSGAALSLPATDRAALDDPKLEASSPDDAYVPRGGAEARFRSATSSAEPRTRPGRASGGAAVRRRE